MTEDMINALTAQGYTITPPPPPPPVEHCAVCGMTGEENRQEYGGWLIDVTLMVNVGEEGASQVTRFYCDKDIVKVADAVVPLGLGSHRHGSTTIIEADPERCGGYDRCELFDPDGGYEEVYREQDQSLHAGPA